MASKKVFYYYVSVAPSVNRGVLHFKAYSKRQVRAYLTIKVIGYDRIFDPSNKPTQDVAYLDITAQEIPSCNF